MKKILLFTLILGLLTSLVFPLRIVSTIKPYTLIVKSITGERAEVYTLINPGVNPHTFSPRINDIKKLSSADVVIMNGIGLEAFLIEKLKSMKDNINIIYVENLIPENILKSFNDNKKHFNPHVWLSIDLLTKYIIPGITERLTELDEKNSEYFRKNTENLINDLRRLKKKYFEILSKYSGRDVLVYHPSFYYFFKEYEINEISISEGHGDEPTLKKLMEIIKLVKSGDIVGIFAERQQNIEPIKLISNQADIPFSILDPLGYNEESIIDLFEQNFKNISEVLKR